MLMKEGIAGLNRKYRPPIIIIGMHRSGTSMLTRMLEELGLFVGKKKESNHEALFFLQINDWLLRQSGGAWDSPEPVKHLLNNTQVRALAVDYIRYLMKTPRVVSYLGWGKYLRYRTPANLDIPWGWKDPRNTYTLPLWLDLFPEAKVIHIYRNGVDVANSLKVRGEKDLKKFCRWLERSKWRHSFWNRPFPSIVSSVSCLSLEEGFKLWEAYTSEADHYIAKLPNDRTMSIRYEDFVADCEPFLKSLCKFIGVNYDFELIGKMKNKVQVTRSKAYERDDRLRKFYGLVKNSSQMRRYSY